MIHTAEPTPETDAAIALASDANGAKELCETCARLERQRDKASELCRWAFYRLLAISEKQNITGSYGTYTACIDLMARHPEIFDEPKSTP